MIDELASANRLGGVAGIASVVTVVVKTVVRSRVAARLRRASVINASACWSGSVMARAKSPAAASER
jgi:hypothetical protein